MSNLDSAELQAQLDVEGFLIDGSSWTPEIAEAIARRAGIDSLGDKHWRVVALCREEAARRGRSPDLQRLCSLAALDLAALCHLFGADPGPTIARIAGHPKPRPWSGR